MATAEEFQSKLDIFSSESYKESQYQKGIKIGKEANEVIIGENWVWSAQMKDGSNIYSYEKLGYHAHTAALFQGFIDSGVKIRDLRKKD